MVVNNSYLSSLFARLIGLGFVVLPAVTAAESQLYAQQEWVCQPEQQNGWQCQRQQASAGIYPPVAKFQTDSGATGASTANTATQVNQQPFKARWDWIPKDQLPEGIECKKGCNGAYVAPKPDWPEAEKNPENASVHADADRSSMENDIVKLYGDVSLSQGHRRVKADKVTVDRNADELVAKGNIELREPGLLMRADRVFIDTATNLGEFKDSRFVQHTTGTRGKAKTVKRESESVITLQQGSFTQCTPDDQLWLVDADKIRLDSETGWGTARNATVKVKDVPVFYTPYITFPIDDRRKSGFLFPSLGSSGDNGFEISAPYYLNLAPNYDATVAPRYISNRGTMAELELRHLSRFGLWALSGAYLEDDDLFTGDDDTDTSQTNNTDFVKQDRWLGNIAHTGQIGVINTFVDYTKVSDNDYFKDLTINSLAVRRQTHLNQQAGLSYNTDYWQTLLTATQYQTIDNDIDQQYKLLPRFSALYSSIADSFDLQWIAELEFTRFDHDQSINQGGRFETGQRTYTEAGISYPMQWPAGFIVPTVKVRNINYDMDEVAINNDTSYSVTTPLATLDLGLIFERNLALGDSSYLQTLEPRLFYFYSDFEDQRNNPNFDPADLTFTYSQLYRDTRFSGHDRLDDANQVSAGLTTRFIDDNSGREVFSASIGQVFYFRDRNVRSLRSNIPPTRLDYLNRVSNSFIASELQFQPIDDLWFSNTLLWDSRQDYLQEGGLSMQYRPSNSSLYNIGYRYRRQGASNLGSGLRDVDQLDLSLTLPLSASWKIYSRYQYDLDGNRSLEEMFGIGYEDCCWAVRLVYQRAVEDEFLVQNLGPNNELINNVTVERDNVFVLEFQLKGLGGIGNKAATLLEESILGYSDRNE